MLLLLLCDTHADPPCVSSNASQLTCKGSALFFNDALLVLGSNFSRAAYFGTRKAVMEDRFETEAFCLDPVRLGRCVNGCLAPSVRCTTTTHSSKHES
jgi:hypothetical protein